METCQYCDIDMIDNGECICEDCMMADNYYAYSKGDGPDGMEEI